MEKYNRALEEGEDQLTNVDRHVLNGLHWVDRCEENYCMQRTTFLKCHLQIDSEGSVREGSCWKTASVFSGKWRKQSMYQVSFIRLLKTTSSSLDKNIVVIYDQFERKMKLEKNNIDQKGEELDKEKIERFI